jgi:hypothetical protein
LFIYAFLSLVVVDVEMNEPAKPLGHDWLRDGTVNQLGSPLQLMVLPLDGRL